MTELKSLKDLKQDDILEEYNMDFVFIEELKAEAIKWYHETTCTKDDWILFFGLSWEDLK